MSTKPNPHKDPCPYCGARTELVDGEAIYPHRPDLKHKWFWVCISCDAYVGCHPGTKNPLGRLANAELRAAKRRAHDAFDPLWRDGHMSRSRAYIWLTEQLDLKPGECHIGMFDLEQCRAVVRACRARKPADVYRGSRPI